MSRATFRVVLSLCTLQLAGAGVAWAQDAEPAPDEATATPPDEGATTPPDEGATTPPDETTPVDDGAAATEPSGIGGPAAPAPPRPRLTLPKGKLGIALNIEANLSKDLAFKPLSLAPDISYGVTPKLTVMLVHSRFATTGFRGAAGSGLCITGKDNGCPKAYNNLGFEALFALLENDLKVAANGGVHVVDLDQTWIDLKVGAKIRHDVGKLFVTFLPAVYVGLNKRDEGNKGSLWAPVALWYKVIPKLALFVSSGIKGPISKFEDGFTIAAGGGGQYMVNKQAHVGASLIYPKVTGADAVPAKGADARYVQLWVGYTLYRPLAVSPSRPPAPHSRQPFAAARPSQPSAFTAARPARAPAAP
ncbi:MAG: hypothetical protein IT370_37715, partial [Deltaproteobacteria bacterium]|nr:hypothetical protein [Deltaproteobacteria bacterium]